MPRRTLGVVKRRSTVVAQRFKRATDGLQLDAGRYAKRHDHNVIQDQHVRIVRHHYTLRDVKQREIVVVELLGHRVQEIKHV